VIRIIAGTLKGRKLETPDWEGLRPTSDKLRETLFNVLGPSVQGSRVIDAYAGTGAVGIEALSRGARHVTFVEQDARAARLIETNLARCGLTERYAIIRAGFAGVVQRLADERPDILFLDPPYGSAGLREALDGASALALPTTVVVVEHASRDAAPDTAGALVRTRALQSGDSALAFYRRAPARGAA
jgi:16S rRNA (guanine(966)-N(2))-methyltransferase RsmD